MKHFHYSRDPHEIQQAMERIHNGNPAPTFCYGLHTSQKACACKALLWPLKLGDTVQWEEHPLWHPRTEETVMLCEGQITDIVCKVYTETPTKNSQSTPSNHLENLCCYHHLSVTVTRADEHWEKYQAWVHQQGNRKRTLAWPQVLKVIRPSDAPQEYGPLFGSAT